MTDHLYEAHQAALRHLRDCEEALDSESVSEHYEWPADLDVLAPYCGCGCDDCQVREALHAAFPHIAAAVLAGDVPERYTNAIASLSRQEAPMTTQQQAPTSKLDKFLEHPATRWGLYYPGLAILSLLAVWLVAVIAAAVL